MKKALTALQKLLHPPGWVLLLMPPVVFAALAFIFLTGQTDRAPAYPIYGLSAYCLTILILPLPNGIRRAKAGVTRWINSTAFGGRYMHDLAFRGSVSLYQGMSFNFLYVAFRIAVGIRCSSVWSISMAAYYLALALIRLSLILNDRRKDERNELRCYRRTAWLLFLLNIPMGGMILLMVLTDAGYSYPGYVIYLSAIYAFYSMAAAAANLIRFHSLGSPLLSAAKVLNFIAALMSLFGLQTAMIARFSPEDGGFRKQMNAITGGFTYGCIILIAIYMLLHSRALRKKAEAIE